MILKARYIVPVDSPVIEHGCIVVDGERIRSVGPSVDHEGQGVVDFGEAVLTPGFVNAHSHLELTALAGRVPPTADFVDWLRRLMVIRNMEPTTREAVKAAVRDGVSKSLNAGVTSIGDITTTPAWTREILTDSRVSAVSFGEVTAIGRRRHLLTDRLDAAAEMTRHSPRMRVGISPHAPYSVAPDALQACARRAESLGAPLCIHLAETPDEARFTRDADGPFADFLRELGIWDDSVVTAGCTPVELVHRSGLLGPRTVIAHANYVSDADLDIIARSQASVVYCPRTHAAFGHAPHRFRDMLAAGINVCVGTDSLASNPSLSVLDELRFLHRSHPTIDPTELLAMGTIRGATALGLADETGSLTPGKYADLVVMPLDANQPDIGWEAILTSTGDPTAVYFAGVLVAGKANRSARAIRQ